MKNFCSKNSSKNFMKLLRNINLMVDISSYYIVTTKVEISCGCLSLSLSEQSP